MKCESTIIKKSDVSKDIGQYTHCRKYVSKFAYAFERIILAVLDFCIAVFTKLARRQDHDRIVDLLANRDKVRLHLHKDHIFRVEKYNIRQSPNVSESSKHFM
jgi:hypothetical protein